MAAPIKGDQNVLEAMARAGYAARGAVFLIVGGLALVAALGSGDSKPAGSKGALVALLGQPFGKILLGVVAAGLVGFAVWRFLQGVVDADHQGTETKAILRRIGQALSGAIYIGLAA